MSILNQIVPRLTRSLGQRQNDAPAHPSAGFTTRPAYELTETSEAWGLTIHLPGVTKDGLTFTAEDGLITIHGRRAWQKPEDWTVVYRESVDAAFELVLEHDNTVNTDKIHAELKDGVLRVSLPKTEALRPRKIVVH